MKINFNAMELKKTLRFINQDEVTMYFNCDEKVCFIHSGYLTFRYLYDGEDKVSFAVKLKSSPILEMINGVRSKRTLLITECKPLNETTVNVVMTLNKDEEVIDELPMIGNLIAYIPKKAKQKEGMETSSDLIAFFDLSKNRNISEYIPLTHNVYIWKMQNILTFNTVGVFERYSYCTHTDQSLKDGIYTFSSDALSTLCNFHSEFLMKTSYRVSFRGKHVVFSYKNASIEFPLTKVSLSMTMHPMVKKTVCESATVLHDTDGISDENTAKIPYLSRKLKLVSNYKIYEMERCYVFQKSDGNTIAEAIFMKQRL